MASSSEPRVLSFLAGAAVPAYSVVKPGADKSHVLVSAAASSKNKGISQNVASVAGDTVEVALPGGGGKAVLGGSVSDGDYLSANASGALIVASSGDHVSAQAQQDGVSGDVIAVEVLSFILP